MASWREILNTVSNDVDDHFDRLKYKVAYRFWGPDRVKILPYRGYGTKERIHIKGRVLENQGVTPPTENDSIWRNLLNMYRRAESDEVPFARLRARIGDTEKEIAANKEGYFDLWMTPSRPLATDKLWHEIEFELLEPLADEQEPPVRATGQVLVPPDSARYAVVSDIDDTVLQTDVAHLLRMARNTFLRNAHTRMPFPGVAAFYRALYDGASGAERNPLFYVSNGPWNLYDLLSDFFRLNEIPVGPVLFLRDYGITEKVFLRSRRSAHKQQTIREMIDLYEDLPFILIGDSGQVDPEIYHDIAAEHPDRILAIYIRNVSRKLQRAEAIRELAEEAAEIGTTLILADDTVVLAEHAVEQGWIAPESLPEIRGEKERDESPATGLEKLLMEEEEEGPTVVIEGETPEETEEAIEHGAIEEALAEGEEEQRETPTVIVEPEENGGAEKE